MATTTPITNPTERIALRDLQHVKNFSFPEATNICIAQKSYFYIKGEMNELKGKDALRNSCKILLHFFDNKCPTKRELQHVQDKVNQELHGNGHPLCQDGCHP